MICIILALMLEVLRYVMQLCRYVHIFFSSAFSSQITQYMVTCCSQGLKWKLCQGSNIFCSMLQTLMPPPPTWRHDYLVHSLQVHGTLLYIEQEHEPWRQTARIPVFAVCFVKLLNFYVPQFPRLRNGDKINAYFIGLYWEVNKWKCCKALGKASCI